MKKLVKGFTTVCMLLFFTSTAMASTGLFKAKTIVQELEHEYSISDVIYDPKNPGPMFIVSDEAEEFRCAVYTGDFSFHHCSEIERITAKSIIRTAESSESFWEMFLRVNEEALNLNGVKYHAHSLHLSTDIL